MLYGEYLINAQVAYVCVCMYVRMHTHTHTHTHVYMKAALEAVWCKVGEITIDFTSNTEVLCMNIVQMLRNAC